MEFTVLNFLYEIIEKYHKGIVYFSKSKTNLMSYLISLI